MEYSVIIPLKNEAESIFELVHELEQTMQRHAPSWELICVDDGSTDQTLSLLTQLQKTRTHLKIITFDKNYGQSSAFDAGFKAAQGRYIITMDGDGQNDPADIPKFLSLAKDYDLICGQRQRRQDPFLKRVISLAANQVRSRFCGDGVKDTGCSLKLYRALCLKQIKLFHGMHRFLPALFLIEGFRIKEIPVNHRQRRGGKTKYNLFNRSFNTIFDMFAVRWMRKRHLNYQTKLLYPSQKRNRSNNHDFKEHNNV